MIRSQPADADFVKISKRMGGAFVILGCLLVASGLLQSHRPNWAIAVSGVVLASAGVLRLRRRASERAGSAGSLVLAGAMLAIAGLSFTFAPLVAFGLHHWSLGFIFAPGILAGPYFAFLGYVLLWSAIVGTDPPYAKRFGALVGRAARIGSRPL
jgi:hypothetical protein